MSHASTWTNSDGLTIGYGVNSPEYDKAGVLETDGVVKEAVLHIDGVNSTFGESATYIQLPRMTKLLGADFRVDVAWAGGTSLSVGHTEAGTADVDALFTTTALAQAAMTPAGKVIVADGTYFADTNSVKIPAVITDDADDATIGAKVFITSTGTWTAGKGTLIVRYVQLGY